MGSVWLGHQAPCADQACWRSGGKGKLGVPFIRFCTGQMGLGGGMFLAALLGGGDRIDNFARNLLEFSKGEKDSLMVW